MDQPKIKSIKELQHQIALGTVELSPNIPKNIGLTSTTRRTLTGSKIHRMLSRAVELGGTISRKEISEVASTTYDSRHIDHAEVLGLIKRLHPYAPQRGRRDVSYEITELGRRAGRAFQLKTYLSYNLYGGLVRINIKINLEAFLYHAVSK
ncbi:hypothetical protein LCGC14_2023750 [marine sediment metagenome]|uniref:Uncharacterized protein n=1 Tax=marine sediment metagenome TaxID=412755 RepID=A0A0F9EWS1_9ZZZZ